MKYQHILRRLITDLFKDGTNSMCIYKCAASRHKCEDMAPDTLNPSLKWWSVSSSGRFIPAIGGLVATDVAVTMFLGTMITICRYVQIFFSMSVRLTACKNREIC